MAFSAGQPLKASDLNMVPASNSDATSRTTTSISFTTTLSPANICGVAFTAPPSGKIVILWRCNLSNNSSPNIAQASPSIRTGSTVGSGSVFLASSGGTTITAIANTSIGTSTLVTGLSAGTVYNVALEHRAFSAGTASFADREVIVIPQLA